MRQSRIDNYGNYDNILYLGKTSVARKEVSFTPQAIIRIHNCLTKCYIRCKLFTVHYINTSFSSKTTVGPNHKHLDLRPIFHNYHVVK